MIFIIVIVFIIVFIIIIMRMVWKAALTVIIKYR